MSGGARLPVPYSEEELDAIEAAWESGLTDVAIALTLASEGFPLRTESAVRQARHKWGIGTGLTKDEDTARRARLRCPPLARDAALILRVLNRTFPGGSPCPASI